MGNLCGQLIDRKFVFAYIAYIEIGWGQNITMVMGLFISFILVTGLVTKGL